MKVGALVLGIIGGLIALAYGAIGFALGGIGHWATSFVDPGDPTYQIMQFLSVVLPIVALIGAGLVMAQPVLGASLMGVAAIAFVIIVGFTFFSMIPVILLGIGALLGYLESQNESTG